MTFEYILNERAREEFEKGEAVGLEKGLSQGRSEGEAVGLEKGRNEGEAIGAAQKQREIAKNLKQAGIPVKVIAENTGLSCEEVERL